MFKTILKTVCLIAAVIILVAGCTEITSLTQPSTADDGEQFEVTVVVEYDEGTTQPDDVCHALLYIMLPDQFSVDNGTYSMSIDGTPMGSGTAVFDDLADATPYADERPVPDGYVWSKWRTDQSQNTGSAGVIYEVTYIFNITANALKNEDYTISYAAGVHKQGSPTLSFWGMEEDQSWDNPITVTTGSSIKSVSLGELKANFK